MEYPVLYIGSAVTDFKKKFNGAIIKLTTVDDVKEFVSYYSGISVLDRPLVFEDLSFLPEICEGYLLKFIEESSLDLIILSYYDKVSPIMLSRIKKVIKYYNDEVSSEFLRPIVGLRRIEEALSPDTSYYDKVRYQGKNSPLLYYLDSVIEVSRVKNKVINFMG